ncbi:diaminopimelate decarboxylase [Planococcus lenghuensis]|uniref:Diaminopimelate decarboxylase n=1 Tax=Planococcus lenghuensis TaxID=2213202 RepID=A0A1Q2KY21_9BACL|nr:diaminopimelate decarboxylase [Planococcus lenghuensis]AQQ53089.1 diaminopimelate decarboxylase [Planococcus lenghuensis]
MNLTRNERGELTIRGVSLPSLADAYGTPLFVYDEDEIRSQCRRFHDSLSTSGLDYTVSYASKAFSSVQLFRLMNEEAMGLDVVSEGELYTALASGFPADRIHFHGNNKTEAEIRYALDAGIEYFVIDSIGEIERIDALADRDVEVLVRINPGVEAHTHEFIQTGQEDSKFGLSIEKGLALDGISRIQAAEHLVFKGVHFHIGSQIYDPNGMITTIDKVLRWLHENNIQADVLNAGGGFSIRYTDEDISYPIEDGVTRITETVKNVCAELDYPVPHLSLEPGRSIVGEAGLTLYRVGTVKDIPDVNTYVSIDGGMSDHIRTALYDAKYTLQLANREPEGKEITTTVAGKLCESGDLIAKGIELPPVEPGDLLAVLSTGAYHYSMASNYNQMLKPAIVFVSGNDHRLVIRRQSLEDLLVNEVTDDQLGKTK